MKQPSLLLMILASFYIAAPTFAAPDAGTATLDHTKTVVKDVAPDDAEKLLQGQAKPLVIDVRTPEEFSRGHLPEAMNLDFLDDQFVHRIAKLDKGKPILLHCASGSRSTRALKLLQEQGFPAIYHLTGGFKAWQDAGKPIVKTL